VYVFSGRTGELLFDIRALPSSVDLGYFFVAGVGDVNKDRTPDIYAADFNDSVGTGRAGVYSGRDGSELLSWVGEPGAGFGPGREAGDVDRDGRPDVAVGSYTSSAGAAFGGKIEIFSGRDGSRLRSITSLTANEQLGFDAVGIGDVDRDHVPTCWEPLRTARRSTSLPARRRTVSENRGNSQRRRGVGKRCPSSFTKGGRTCHFHAERCGSARSC
jgi:hypothetical protein